MAPTHNPGPLSADRWNPVIAELEDFARDVEDLLMREYYASGHPLGTEMSPDAEVYQRLLGLRAAGSPMFWDNPQAQADLERLGARFGAPGPVAVPSSPEAAGRPPLPQLQMQQLALVAPVQVPVGGPGPGQPAEYPGALTGGR